MKPGETIPASGELILNAALNSVTITVANSGDRPIQVGSHYHFFETNPAPDFRPRAHARPAAEYCRRHRSAIRTWPVTRRRTRALRRRTPRVWFSPTNHGVIGVIIMTTLSRAAYAAMYGPTTGDRIRLADTELIVEVEQDFTTYGEEVTFGGGKVIRDGMGQSQGLSAEVADLVITNALIIDHWGHC